MTQSCACTSPAQLLPTTGHADALGLTARGIPSFTSHLAALIQNRSFGESSHPVEEGRTTAPFFSCCLDSLVQCVWL